jgi:Flp pilus assembly protein TadG
LPNTPTTGLEALRREVRSFARNRRGNVAIIVAFVALALCFAAGMGVDYTLATERQEQIDGYADAAALAAVTPHMMTQTDAVAQAAAQQVFDSQLATVKNITYSPANISITDSESITGAQTTRTVTVTWTANSTNVFSSLLQMPSLPIGGTASATSTDSPKTDFYLLLDTSPSMEIAATQAGINTMVAATSAQGGCAFGCHESAPQTENPALGNPGGEDNYALARNLGVTLRIDNVNAATTSLMSTATTTATNNNTTYRAAIYTMDYSLNQLIGIRPPPAADTSNLVAAQAAAANITALEVYDNNCLTQSNCNSDEDSYLDTNLASMNTIMPNPGNGSNTAGDTPQEVLMIVSDGVQDYLNAGCTYTTALPRCQSPINTSVNPANNLDWCTTIKNRGIRIAFLYLEYYPLPTNTWYNTNIAPFQAQIATAAQNCASSGLYFEVTTGGDVTGAMADLFQKAVATARLIH